MNCSPCLVRGRQREASKHVDGEPWCEQCFAGAGEGKELVGEHEYALQDYGKWLARNREWKSEYDREQHKRTKV